MLNLSKMFDFHTAVILVATVTLLFSCATQGRVENNTKHQQHNHHHNHKSHYHHHGTPNIETTTNNPEPTSGKESTFKTDKESEATITMNALTSTTSTPSQHHNYHSRYLPMSNQRNGPNLILNTSNLPAYPTTHSNADVEHHTHQQQQDIPPHLVATPLVPAVALSTTSHQYKHNDGGNQRRPSFTVINPLDNSNYSSSSDAMDRDIYMFHRPPGRPQYPQEPATHEEFTSNIDMQQQRREPHKEDEDYYEDYNEDDDGEDDEDDIDGFVDDTDNNLSDRSYARITRSKLDNDYIDDEPYRNGIEDEMQGDAPPGVLTEQKYMDLGNEKAVQQARERYIQEQKRPKTPHELATEHWQRMIHATKCRKPLPRVIPVSNNTSKRYEPYATILHRCGEDTGCCGSTASVCTVKRYETVMVYVFSYDFNYRKEIEALPMHNHTECHCVNRASLQHDTAPRGKRSGESWPQAHQSQLFSSRNGLYAKLLHRSDIQTQRKAENTLSCQCPRHFSVFEDDVERYAHLPRPHTVFTRKCRCDCRLNNQTCLRFKNGEEGFSLEDRRCITEHSCKPPSCTFGNYHNQSGRCPAHKVHNTVLNV